MAAARENIFNITKSAAHVDTTLDTPSDHITVLQQVRPKRYYKPEVKNKQIINPIAKKYTEHRTMGVSKTDLPQPQDYLKKGYRLQQTQPAQLYIAEKRIFQRRPLTKPPVPSCVVSNSDIKRENKNFCSDNVKTISNLEPPQTKPKIVFTSKGKTQNLENSGLQQRYIYRKDMGRVPRYIKKYRQEAIERQEEAAQRDEESQIYQEIQKQNIKEQRAQRIQELKDLWTVKNKEFLLLPVVTDILARVRHRYTLEKELGDIESELDRLMAIS